jgi:putative ABC transport system ATP-binding protein
MPIVVTEGLGKTYGSGETAVTALDSVGISVEPGEFVAIMGPSGCGKSTLLNLVGGLDRPTSGRVLIDGADLTTLDDDKLTELRRRRMGFIFQFYNLIPVLTAYENVELPLLLTSLSKKDRRQHVETALTVVGLQDRMRHYPKQLSGGQEQRVAIARAITTDPTILVADEPTGDLDKNSADEILMLLERLNTEFHKTIVMVTHDPRAAEKARVIRHLDKGEFKRS